MIKFKGKEQAKVTPQRQAAEQLLQKLKRTLEMEAGRGNITINHFLTSRGSADRNAFAPQTTPGTGFYTLEGVVATGGTCDYLQAQGLKVERIKKVLEGRPHIVDAMKNREVQLVFNTTEGKQSLSDSFELRRTALMMKIPYYTTTAGALAAAQAIALATPEGLEVRALQSY